MQSHRHATCVVEYNYLLTLSISFILFIVLPYIILGITEGVGKKLVPQELDGLSSPINITFPFGAQIETNVYVRILGVLSNNT